MTTPSLTRVLLLENAYASAHAAREVTRRAGLNLRIESATSAEDYLDRLERHDFDLLLIGASGFAGHTMADILKRSSSLRPSVSVIVFGDETGYTGNAIQALRLGASDYIQTSQFSRLPVAIERALRDQHARNLQASLQQEVDHAADVLRENQKMVTIGRLTASISHEINNPLESITNLLYLLHLNPGLPEDSRRYLDLAQKELSRVVQIARQTLNFYRETAVPVRISLSSLLDEVLVLYRRRIAEKHLEVKRQYDFDEPVTIFPGEMRQVFSNLITNAIEASETGGMLRLRMHKSRQWSDHEVRGLRISIGDTGSGIPAEVRRRLGEPFYTTKGQGGTGLGLWVTQGIVRRYGGNLQLHSSVSPAHHGTVFSVFLPTNLKPHPVASPPEHRGESGSIPTRAPEAQPASGAEQMRA